MRKAARFVVVLSVCSFILTFAFVPLAIASTVEVPLFGPEQFVRDTGSPVTETRQFSVQRLVADSYVLRVGNGSMEGDSLVSSAVITLNGTVVLKQNDFNQGVYSLEKPVGVQATNTLEVKLGSIPTSYLSLTIVGNYLPEDVDDDGDGYTENEGDCDDADALVNPDAAEICNEVDDNCDSQIDEGVTLTFYPDADGDGYGLFSGSIQACSAPSGYAASPGDCNDLSFDVNPGATEVCNAIDDNCDTQVDEGFDTDGDGYTSCGGDCNDAYASINPTASEVCDGIDNNCSGQVDEGVTTTFYLDSDGDGYGVSIVTVEDCAAPTGYAPQAGDCNDSVASVNPAAVDVCNSIDDNCDGIVDPDCLTKYCPDGDKDGYGNLYNIVEYPPFIPPPDGYLSAENCTDCRDDNPTIHPGLMDIPDGVDNDCDGIVDNVSGEYVLFYRDADSDGFGNPSAMIGLPIGSTPPPGFVQDNTDCGDFDASTNPGAAETCDGVDNNCDSRIDEGVIVTFYVDMDKDGYGRDEYPVQSCSSSSPGFFYAEQGGDCDDNRDDTNPGAVEICNSRDDNCDGLIDNGEDLDGDGFDTICGNDCDDSDPAIYYGATELCDGHDNDCDGLVDEWGTTPSYRDYDGDGYGSDIWGVRYDCTPIAGYVFQGGDCNDFDSAFNPGGVEVCDNIDNDCDGLVDEAGDIPFYRDADGDGYGDDVEIIAACSAPEGYVDRGGDCDDSLASVNPEGVEICNGFDENCNGQVDEGTLLTFYLDGDGDGYGLYSHTTEACAVPEGYADKVQDCNDTDPAINPGAVEICDGIDNNCTYSVDEGFDQDGDGYTTCGGDCNDSRWFENPGRPEECNNIDDNCDGVVDEGFDSDADGYSTCQGDCQDADPAVNPGAAEICNGIDDDCDGITDSGCLTGISVTPQAVTLNLLRSSEQLAVTGHYADGVSADLTGPASGTVYLSGNQDVVTVSSEGLIALSGLGSTSVTVENGDFAVSVAVSVIRGAIDYQPQPENSFGAFYEDLVPPDSLVEEYDPARFSIITGLVEDRSGMPIAGVTVSVHGHLEYGSVQTDTDGRFSLPVEGEGTMTIVFKKEGLLTSHRKVYVPWNDVALSETVTMITFDTVSTQIQFDGNPQTIYTHQSTPTVDDRGWRNLTMTITGDNRAYTLDGDGNQVWMPIINVRGTEFDTEQSMPAMLPPNSAYTYCVELAADEADTIWFEKPITIYVDNFIGFEVGMTVPVGSYNRNIGEWTAEKNGIVVRLLDLDNDGVVDALDVDGDGAPDDLNSDDSFADEVAGLDNPAAFPPGKTLWRASISHFTPFDLNWPFMMNIPAGANPRPATSADPIVAGLPADCKDCPTKVNSYIENRRQVYHKDVPIPGTGMTLHYASNRVEDYQTRIIVPASGSNVISTMKRIIVELWVAGRYFKQELPAQPYQMAEFLWDGKDWRGAPITWTVNARVRIGYLYDVYFWKPYQAEYAFGQPGVEPTGYVAHREYPFEVTRNVKVERYGTGSIAKGWTLSVHHQAHPSSPGTLIKGDGSFLHYATRVMNTIAGQIGQWGLNGMGGPAKDATIDEPQELTTDGQGNVYINTPFYGINSLKYILKIDKDGIVDIFAGDGSLAISGDGGPALQAGLGWVTDIDVDSAGNVFVATANRVRKIDTNGIITTVSGTGESGYSGDGGPATSAKLSGIQAIDNDPFGNLYILQSISGSTGGIIRKVDPSGIISTYGGSEVASILYRANDIATDNEGNLFVATFEHSKIYRIDISGTVSHFAGNGGYDQTGDGGPATEAAIQVNYMEGDKHGNLFFVGWINQSQLRVIDSSGIISTVAGTNPNGQCGGDGRPASESNLCYSTGLTLDLDGNVYVSFGLAYVLGKVSLSSEQLYDPESGGLAYVEDSGVAHIVNFSGKHLRTVDTATGTVLYTFGYDGENNLTSITDRFGKDVTVERDAGGRPTAIISPDGIRTALVVDGNGHLVQVSYPDSTYYSMAYTGDGLMTDEHDPNGNHFSLGFDGAGRLVNFYDETGGHWSYGRTVDARGQVTNTETTGEGDATVYESVTDKMGNYNSNITGPDGSDSIFSRSGSGLLEEKQTSCGPSFTRRYSLDSEYSYRDTKNSTIAMPSGLSVATSRDRAYTDTDSDGTPDRITDTVTVNGKASTVVNDVLAGTVTATSPTGRQVTSYYSPATLLTSRTSTPGLFDTDFTYDARGRLDTVTVGSRTTGFAYDGFGYLDYMTTPDGRTFDYTYDVMGRLIDESRPDGSQVSYGYDANGNVTAILNPNNVTHGFNYTANDQREAYNTPISGSYTYLYDRDRRLKSVTYPSGQSITNNWGNGQLQTTSTPEGLITYGYDCGGKVGSVTKGGESSSFTYDGSLLLSDTRAGTVSGTISYGYNSDLRVGSIGYAGANDGFSYDLDGLLTGAGAYTITRNVSNGLPESVSDGTVTQGRSFSGYGEVDGVNYTVGAAAPYSWGVVRDNAGRITQKVENIGTDTVTWDYTYDLMGRLETVTKDGVLAESYSYDGQGNRTSETNLLRNVSRTYTHDSEDKVVYAGSDTYTFDVDGFLTSRTISSGAYSGTATFDYSSRGELLSASLPTGDTITYQHDPMGRRVAKRVNGVMVEKYLWADSTTLLAIYDGSDNLIQRFEYADGRMPVSMTQGGQVYYLAYDQVGSLRLISDAAGIEVKKVDYDTFGNILSDSNPIFAVPLGFAGGLQDRDTGLVRFGARDYDPAIGKWTAKDPIDFAGGDLNLFGYGLNSPTSRIDPNGLDSYLVIRPFGVKGVGWFVGHAFIVTNVNVPGVEPTIYSFGKNNGGYLGLVDDTTKGFSRGTSERDQNAWDNINCPDSSPYANKIDSPDELVDFYAQNLMPNLLYNWGAGEWSAEANSNSAALAIARAASGTNMNMPSILGAPGASSWHKIQYNTMNFIPY